MSDFYDIHGNRLEFFDWARRFEDRSPDSDWSTACRFDVAGRFAVSTQWFGLDMWFFQSDEERPPLTFEVCVFEEVGADAWEVERTLRFPTMESAHDAHDRLVEQLRMLGDGEGS